MHEVTAARIRLFPPPVRVDDAFIERLSSTALASSPAPLHVTPGTLCVATLSAALVLASAGVSVAVDPLTDTVESPAVSKHGR